MAKDGRLYAKFTLDFPDSHKVMPLSDKAFRALVEMTIWSRKQMTDGFIASRLALARWSLEVCQELLENDPEKPSLIEVENGYLIHDFAEHQSTRAEIESLSEKRKAAGQMGGRSKALASAKQIAKQKPSKALAETETKTKSLSYVLDDCYVSNARGTVVVPDAPEHVDNGARPTRRTPSSASRTVVRHVLGSGYPRATVDRLAVQVEKLFAEGHPDALIRESLAEWQRRPNCNRPEWLPTVLGDVVKKSRESQGVTPGESKVLGWAALGSPGQADQKAIQ